MTNLDKEEKTQVVCPTCGKHLGTWGVNYFNHCGARHNVIDNLAEEVAPKETVLTETDLEEDEKLVRCEKCGEFLITTEEKEFEHCGVKQLIADCLGNFDDLNGGEEKEGEEKDSEGKSTATYKTKAILSTGKGSRKTRKSEKIEKTGKTRKKEEEPDKGEDESPKTGEDEPDKEEELWVCLTCDEIFNDKGYSDAVCPSCGTEYARPVTNEELERLG